MKRLNSLAATVVAISLLAPSAAFAAPAGIHVPRKCDVREDQDYSFQGPQ